MARHNVGALRIERDYAPPVGEEPCDALAIVARGGLDFIEAEDFFRCPSETVSLRGPFVGEDRRAFDDARLIGMIEVTRRRATQELGERLGPFARETGVFEGSGTGLPWLDGGSGRVFESFVF